MDELDRRIINALQGGFPVVERPFAAAAQEIGASEDDLLAAIAHLLGDGVLSRFGPLFNADRMGGAFTLCAMQVPGEEFERVAQIVNGFPQVAHNYERAHRLNMWFVLASDMPEGIAPLIAEIEQATGLQVLDFPKLEEYFIEMTLTV
jgi:DNA-binding Lrp family transcriptional regulator